MKKTLSLIATLTLLTAGSVQAIGDQTTFDGTGAAEIEAQGPAGMVAIHPIFAQIKAVREQAREVGYFDAYMLMQDVIKGRPSKNGNLLTPAEKKAMTVKKNAALKVLNTILGNYEGNYMCQDSLKQFIQQEQSGAFISTASTSATTIKASATELNSWKYTSGMWSKGHNKELEETIRANCTK